MEKELVVGATGRSSGSYYYPAALNAFAGTKFKIVFGYRGGADVNIAMERGEVGGRGSNLWASWVSTRPQWLAENKIHMLVQIALKRHPDLKDVPLMQEIVKSELHKQVMTFIRPIPRLPAPSSPHPICRRSAWPRCGGVRCRHEGPGAAQGSRHSAHQDISPTTGDRVAGRSRNSSSPTPRRKSSPKAKKIPRMPRANDGRRRYARRDRAPSNGSRPRCQG